MSDFGEMVGQNPNFQTMTAANGVVSVNGIIGAGLLTGSGAVSYGSVTPITLYAKSVTVLTAAAPVDIATIIIPNGINRWMISSSNSLCAAMNETQSGAFTGAQCELFDGANGTGQALTPGPFNLASGGLTGANSRQTISGGTPNSVQSWSTSGTIYIRQTANSANAGTCSFYITIFPLP